MNENKRIVRYDPQTGVPIYENNVASQNPVMPQNNVAQPNPVMPQNNVAQPNPVMPQNNVAPQNPVMPQNNIAPQNPVMPQNNVAQPNPVMSQNNVAQPNPVMPQNNVAQPNPVMPQNNVAQQNPVMPQNNVAPQNPVMPQQKRKSKKLLFTVLSIVAILLIVGILLFAFGDSNKSRTFMIYMIGSDLESEGGMASIDVNEIKNAGVNLEDNNVLIYSGGAKKWHNDFENNSVYELTEDGFVKVSDAPETSMGSSTTLTQFLNYSHKNYKSDSYDLILWDHGAGPILGYGVDENYDSDGLLMEELYTALKNSSFSSNDKLEMIGFDACLMASAEVASVLSDFTNYMVASQDLEPGFGWDYSFLKEINKDVDVVSLGKHIIDYNDSYYKKMTKDFGGSFYTTLSLLDLTKMENLENKLNILFKDVEGTLTSNGYSRIVYKITRAKKFGYAGYDESYDLIDLMGVSEGLVDDYGTKATDLKQAIEDVVVYQKTNVIGANGLSIYYPYFTKSYLAQFLQVYDTLNFASDYTKFLGKYAKVLSGQRLYNYDLRSKTPVFSAEKDAISINLEDEVVAGYNKADYVIFRDMKDGYYMPVYKSSDVDLKDNNLIANFDKKQLSVIDAEGEAGWATMYEYERNDSYTIYNVPAVLIKTRDEYESESVNIQLKIDSENPNGTIVGVIATINVDDTTTMKKVIDLEEWDYIQFFNSEYNFYDESGNYTNDWQSSGTVYLTEVSLKKGYTIEFANLEEDYDYYCMFQVHDTQGNVYYTNLVKVE